MSRSHLQDFVRRVMPGFGRRRCSSGEFFLTPRQSTFNAASMNRNPKPLFNHFHQSRSSQRGILNESLLHEFHYLVTEFVSGLGTSLSREKTSQSVLLELMAHLIERDARKAEGSSGILDRTSRLFCLTQHLVLHLHKIARIEKLVVVEEWRFNFAWVGIERPLFVQSIPFGIGCLDRARSNLQTLNCECVLSNIRPSLMQCQPIYREVRQHDYEYYDKSSTGDKEGAEQVRRNNLYKYGIINLTHRRSLTSDFPPRIWLVEDETAPRDRQGETVSVRTRRIRTVLVAEHLSIGRVLNGAFRVCRDKTLDLRPMHGVTISERMSFQKGDERDA